MHIFENENDVNQYAKGLGAAFHYLNEDSHLDDLKEKDHYLQMVPSMGRDPYDHGWIDGVNDFFVRQ